MREHPFSIRVQTNEIGLRFIFDSVHLASIVKHSSVGVIRRCRESELVKEFFACVGTPRTSYLMYEHV